MVWIFFKVTKNKLNKLADYYEIQYKANNFEENIYFLFQNISKNYKISETEDIIIIELPSDFKEEIKDLNNLLISNGRELNGNKIIYYPESNDGCYKSTSHIIYIKTLQI